jgi:hypothetical protein
MYLGMVGEYRELEQASKGGWNVAGVKLCGVGSDFQRSAKEVRVYRRWLEEGIGLGLVGNKSGCVRGWEHCKRRPVLSKII